MVLMMQQCKGIAIHSLSEDLQTGGREGTFQLSTDELSEGVWDGSKTNDYWEIMG